MAHSLSNSIVIEIDGIPFFADSASWDMDRSYDTPSGMAGSQPMAADTTYTGTVELGGAFIAEEIQGLTEDGDGVPFAFTLCMKPSNGNVERFKDVLSVSTRRCKNELTLDFVALEYQTAH